jgi:N-acetylmuramic acid 6-phosphate (MurNAc-6-P) etherase
LSALGEAYNCSLGRLVELLQQREPPPPPTLLVIVRAGVGELSDGLKTVAAAAAAAAAAAGNQDIISVCTVQVAYADGAPPPAAAHAADADAAAHAPPDASVLCTLPAACIAPSLGHGPAQLAVKLILNAISTCAFINHGCVYGNRMVNLTVSNDKLYSRAVSIVAAITSAGPAAAQHALLRSLYDRDGDTHDLLLLPVAQHVTRGAAKQGQRAVPVAIMLAMDETLSVEQVTRDV